VLGRVAERAFHDAESRAAFAGSQLAAAIVEVPRERFVRLDDVGDSAYDVALALDSSGLATVSAMHAYVRTFTLAGIGEGQRVLDLGGGSGYGAALLRRLVGEQGKVVTVEVDPAHAATAASLLSSDVTVLTGDGLAAETLARAAEAAGGPFDAVVAGFALPGQVPASLGAVLRVGGVVVAPVDAEGSQRLVRATWDGARLESTPHEQVIYVPFRASVAREAAPTPPASDPEPARKKKLKVLGADA
jgi:protein-L-isoaspartate(D-aspartate) O-methyltransferase